MGWENIFHCEWNPFGQRVLKHHFPKAISYNDITQTDFTIHRGNIDLISGGFPCQPYSIAGKRLGKDDERHLWPEMLRCIREVQPKWVVGENVHGLVNWNGGLVFEEVQAELETEGYEVQSFVLPAASVGAPHKRSRVWIVAHAISGRHEGVGNITEHLKSERKICKDEQQRDKVGGNAVSSSRNGFAPDPDNGFSNQQEGQVQARRHTLERGDSANDRRGWQNFPTKPPICGGDDGLSRELDSITFPKWRNESIKAYGNAIVPQVAHQIFKAIAEYENL